MPMVSIREDRKLHLHFSVEASMAKARRADQRLWSTIWTKLTTTIKCIAHGTCCIIMLALIVLLLHKKVFAVGSHQQGGNYSERSEDILDIYSGER